MRATAIVALGIAVVGAGALLPAVDEREADVVLTGATPTATDVGRRFVDPPRASTTVATTSTTSTTSTTAVVACRNSTHPRCGPFSWDPAPLPNQPLVLRVMREPFDTVAGEPVVWRVDVEDGDAQVVGCHVYDFGDGTAVGTFGGHCGNEPGCAGRRFGPWSPPTAKPGAYRYEVTHTYAEAGTYTARFFAFSEDGGQCHPYGDEETLILAVSVSPRRLAP